MLWPRRIATAAGALTAALLVASVFFTAQEPNRTTWANLVLGLAIAPSMALAQKAKPHGGDKVNLNTATVEQLQTLPGVGPAMAKKIVEHRTKSGKFTKVEEILNIQGIGEKKFQKMKDRLVV